MVKRGKYNTKIRHQNKTPPSLKKPRAPKSQTKKKLAKNNGNG